MSTVLSVCYYITLLSAKHRLQQFLMKLSFSESAGNSKDIDFKIIRFPGKPGIKLYNVQDLFILTVNSHLVQFSKKSKKRI